MQVDFYQLSRDPVERVVPLLAAKACERGTRVVLVSREAEDRAALSTALWAREGAFLANGDAGGPHDARQPVLLSPEGTDGDDAALALIADGLWRDHLARFARVILLFAADRTGETRALWTRLTGDGHQLRIFKQREDGGWHEGP